MNRPRLYRPFAFAAIGLLLVALLPGVVLADAATHFVITGSGTQTAGGSQDLTITATDGGGLTDATYVGDHVLTFSGAAPSTSPVVNPTVVDSTGATVDFGTATTITFTAGVATVSLGNNGVMRLYRAQTALISATDGGINSVGFELSVVVSPAALSKFDFVLASPQTNGSAFTGTNTLTAQDQYGNTVTSFDASTDNVTITVNSPLTGVVSGLHAGGNVLNLAGDFSSGVANLTALGMTYTGNAATGTFTATAASTAAGTSGSVAISAGAATKFVITGTGSQTAGASQNLTITAKDGSGNTATGYTGNKNLTFSGAASIGAFNPTVRDRSGLVVAFGTATSIAFTSGVATVSFGDNGVMALYKVETALISAIDGGITTTGTDRLSVVVSHAALNKFAFTLAGSQTNGSAFTGTNTLTAQDQYGNTVTNFDASADNVTITVNAPLTGAVSGLHAGGNVLNLAGDFSSGVANLTALGMTYTGNAATGTFTATAASTAAGTSGSVAISAGAATKFVITGTGSQTAGGSQSLTITAKDASGNTATGYTGDHILTFSGAASIGAFDPTVTDKTVTPIAFGTATTITFTAGVATVGGSMTLYKVETALISATDGSISSTGSDRLSVSVGHAALDHFTINTISSQIAGASFAVTATAKDLYGNTVTDYIGTPVLTNNFSSTGGAPVAGTFSAFSSGTGTSSGTTDFTAETLRTVTVTDTGSGKTGTSNTFSVGHAALDHFTINTISSQTAGASFAVTATAKDLYGNTVTDYVGTPVLTNNFSSTGGAPVAGTFTAFSSGTGTSSGTTDYTAETLRTVTVTDTGSGKTGTSNTFSVLPEGSATQLVVTGPGTATAGVAQDYTVTAKDSHGNTVEAYAGTVTITSSDGAMSSSPASGGLTSGVGVFHVTLRTVGARNVGANDGTLTATALPVTVGSGAAASLTVTGPGTAFAGVPQDYTVTARDAFGNTATTYPGTVTITSSDSAMSSSPASGTLTSGVGVFHVTLRTVGSWNVGANDGTLTAAPVTVVVSTAAATYFPVAPVRVVDTRINLGITGRLLASNPATFQVAGRYTIPANATGVTGNVTVVLPSNAWALFLGPDPIASPASSTINFSGGEIVANGLTVALSATGSLSATYMSTSGNTTDMVFDITGYFVPDNSGATYHPITPRRMLDTRIGIGLSGKLSANTPRTFQITGTGTGKLPVNATAVTGNVTVVNSTFSWAVYLGPDPIAYPPASTINFTTGEIKANSLTVALSTTGSLGATYMSTPGNTTDLVFDVTGYYTADSSGSKYVPLTPVRLLDTRFGNGLSGKLTSNTPVTFTVAGRGGVPANAVGVTGNVTVVNETNAWAVFVGPTPNPTPSTSTVNFNRGDIKSNGFTVALSGTGTLSATYLSTPGQTTDLVVDITGYFVP